MPLSLRSWSMRFGLLAAMALGQVHAQSSNREVEPSIDGCGKAHAAMARINEVNEFSSGMGGVAAEAMSDTDVLQYELDLELTSLNPGANTCTITGQNRITIQSKSSDLTQFTIRLRTQYTVTSAIINDVTPVTVTTNSTTTRTVTLDRAYANDEIFTLTIAYTGNTQSVGLGSFQVSNHASAVVVATLSEPYYSYSWWPVKDGDVNVPGDNSDKALVDIKIVAPNNYKVAANGLLQGIDPLSGNRNRYRWSSSYPIATYLVSFAATNYNKWTQTYTYPGGTMPVEFYIYPELDNAGNRQGWEKSLNMMAVFRPLFGEYPFVNEKYGIYNFPFSGGMEHQTMTGQNSFGESLTAHELGHQWWGDTVTCETWSDIWLNEGFATYSECLWEEYKSGSQNIAAYLAAIVARKPTSFNDTVYLSVAQTADASRIFSTNFTYRKGAWVLHQLRHVVGDSVFFQILANHRAAHEGGTATTNDFIDVASATAGQNLSWFFDQWVFQPGAPSYRYSWDSVEVEGQNYLHLRIEQLQPLSQPTFVMPVDIGATIGGIPQTLVVNNTSRAQRFVLPVSAPVTALSFDPQQWILRSNLTTGTLVVGDMDNGNDVDEEDFTAFESCYSGEGVLIGASCEPGDFDGDQDIDCRDWSAFQTSWTAGGSPPELIVCLAGAVPTASSWALLSMVLGLLIAATLIQKCKVEPSTE